MGMGFALYLCNTRAKPPIKQNDKYEFGGNSSPPCDSRALFIVPFDVYCYDTKDIAMKPTTTKNPIKKKITVWLAVGVAILMLALAVFLLNQTPPEDLDYGYSREISESEMALRQQLINTAEAWLDTVAGSPEHHQIIDLYNAQEVLPVNYLVTYEDSWCATFVTVVALQNDLEDIIPPECGCQRQIALFESIGCWQEDERYVPLPGDIIYYSQKEPTIGDCTGWSDHVGIVVGTAGNYIKVIEGNNNDAVRYRYIHKNNYTIRGYGVPDYSGKSE
jgi:hypothetical protein